MLYLEEVLHEKSHEGAESCKEMSNTQAKLRSLLQKSDLYRIHFILGKIMLRNSGEFVAGKQKGITFGCHSDVYMAVG